MAIAEEIKNDPELMAYYMPTAKGERSEYAQQCLDWVERNS